MASTLSKNSVKLNEGSAGKLPAASAWPVNSWTVKEACAPTRGSSRGCTGRHPGHSHPTDAAMETVDADLEERKMLLLEVVESLL
jgi:hypothetical protein